MAACSGAGDDPWAKAEAQIQGMSNHFRRQSFTGSLLRFRNATHHTPWCYSPTPVCREPDQRDSQLFLSGDSSKLLRASTVHGWDRAPTRRLWEAYQSRSFDCELGSHFHHGYVFGGLPIMPDGRISPVRLKSWPLVREPSHSQRGSSAGSRTPRLARVCSQLRAISCVGLCRL
jgi:hypothetical protein